MTTVFAYSSAIDDLDCWTRPANLVEAATPVVERLTLALDLAVVQELKDTIEEMFDLEGEEAAHWDEVDAPATLDNCRQLTYTLRFEGETLGVVIVQERALG